MRRSLIILTLLLTFSSAYAAQADMARVSENYNNAIILMNSNRYPQAIVEFKKVLRALPYDENVKYALASAYVSRAAAFNSAKEHKKALNDLKSAVFYFEHWGDKITDPQKTVKIEATKRSLAELSVELKESKAPAQILQEAKTLRTQGELAASGYNYTLIKNDPTYSMTVLSQLGDIYNSLNNPMGAMECYRQILAKEPNNALVHFKYATILDGAGNEDAAVDEYNAALKYGENNPEVMALLENLWRSRIAQNPNDAQAHLNLGAIYQRSKNYQGALEQYLIAQKLDPTDNTITLNLASLYISQNNYEGAINAYNALLNKDPNNAKIMSYRAEAYMALKDYKKAMANYNMVLALDPKDAQARAKIDEIISKLPPQEFLNHLEVQANSNPTDYDAQYNFAYQLHKNKDYQKAIIYYTKALNINPKKVEGYLNLARLYDTKNDLKSAEAVLAQGLLHLPANAELLAEKENLAKAQAGDLYKQASELWEKKDFKGALITYQKIPYQTPEVLLAIASCYWELGDEAKSIEYFKKTLEKDPKNVAAREALAEIDRNKAHAAKVKALDDAIALYEAKNWPKANEAFKKINQQDAKNPWAFYYLGAIADELEKYHEAVDYYDKYLALRAFETDEYVKYVKNRVAELKAYLKK